MEHSLAIKELEAASHLVMVCYTRYHLQYIHALSVSIAYLWDGPSGRWKSDCPQGPILLAFRPHLNLRTSTPTHNSPTKIYNTMNWAFSSNKSCGISLFKINGVWGLLSFSGLFNIEISPGTYLHINIKYSIWIFMWHIYFLRHGCCHGSVERRLIG